MRWITGILAVVLLAGCATTQPKPVITNAVLETPEARPWWDSARWLWCGGIFGACPPGPQPTWSRVLNAVEEATRYLDIHSMPTPK